MYTAELKVLGQTYQASGEEIAEAIGNLKPGNVAGRLLLTVRNGKAEQIRLINGAIGKRLFQGSGLTKEVALKQVSSMFNGL